MSRSEEIDKIIEENLENIEQWLKDGLTFEQVAKNLGISSRTLARRRDLPNSRLGQIIKNSRKVAVLELENSMYESALGFERTVKKCQKVKRCIYENGKKAEEWEEMVEYEETVYFPPDTTAAIFLLKNWGKYMNEPVALELRKKELELKEKQIEANAW